MFDPEYAEDDGEVLAECMFTSDFEDEKLKRAYMSNGNDEECERILQLCSIALLALSIYSSCLNKSSDTSLDKSYGKSDSTEIYHTIVSDDSLVTAIWHDTGEGGTAPDIDCVVKFKSEDGKLHEEHRPLLQLAHPNDDYSHHEVQKIVSLDDEYGSRSYIFFLSAKVGSNEYVHDIVAFEISGDSLRYLYNYKID